MTRKKQILFPFAILLIGIGLYFALASFKKPPEEKAPIDNTPIVDVSRITIAPMTLEVDSYGIVQPKYQTTVVAQVSGQIVELAEIFVRGGFVKQGQLLARIDQSDYQAALINAQANLASAQASLQKELAQGKVAEKEWKRISSTAPTDLSLRKPQLAQELAKVKAAQALILRANRNLERTEITAPYDAIIESRNVGLGSFVSIGVPVGKLLATSLAQVRLPIADNQLQFLLAQGHHAKVNLISVVGGKKRQWQARIARNEGLIDSKSRMLYLVAEINDPYALSANNNNNLPPLRFGAYVNAKIQGIELSAATSIPRHLVVNAHVALLSDEMTLHYAAVDIIREKGDQVIINGGLSTHDYLITSALDYPVHGMKLSLQKSEQDNAHDKEASIKLAKVEDQ